MLGREVCLYCWAIIYRQVCQPKRGRYVELYGHKTNERFGNYQSITLIFTRIVHMNRRACVCFATAGVFLLPVSVGARHPAPSGIRFSYVLPQTLTLHEPVCLVSTISNETSDTAQIDLGQDRKGAYVLAVTQPSGVKIDLPPHSHEGISRLSTLVLEPGQFYTQTLVLNEWYAFGTPGRYHVQVRLIHPALVGASSTQVADPGFQLTSKSSQGVRNGSKPR